MFDHDSFVRMSIRFSTHLLVYMPPNETALRVERGIRCLSRKERKAFTAMMEWAERTDPGGEVRNRHIKAAWDNRAPGTEFIRLIGKVD